MNEPEVIRSMLGLADLPPKPRTIAVVGLSDNPMKPSHYVSAYMQQQGYRILGINPALTACLGESCYPTLAALPVKPDLVNVFRLPQFIPAIVDEMIALGLHDLWIQLGIRNEAAAAKAEASGIRVVMDRCIMVEHQHIR